MDSNCRSRRPIEIKKISIYIVVAREVVHVHEVGRYLDYVRQVCARGVQDVSYVLDHNLRLSPNVQPDCPQTIDIRASDRIVGAPGTRSAVLIRSTRQMGFRCG